MRKAQMDIKSENIGLNIAQEDDAVASSQFCKPCNYQRAIKIERENALLVMTGAPIVNGWQGLDEPCVDNNDPKQGTTFN